jgi:hypothetical protein
LSNLKQKDKTRECYFCNCEEGKPRKLGNFIVVLQEVELKSGKEVLACQSCSVHEKKKLKGEGPMKKGVLKKIRAYFS